MNTLDLFQRYRKYPENNELRNRLVEANMGLVRYTVSRFGKRSDYEDLIQVGSYELIRCVERFDITRGHTFSSFALVRIRGSILHYIRDKTHLVKPPRKYAELVSKSKKFHNLTDSQIASELGVPMTEWMDAKLAHTMPKSLDVPVYGDNNATLADTISDTRGETPEQALVEELLLPLDAKERTALELIYLKGMDRKSAGEVMGVSPMTVTRYKRSALQQLRAA
jgi:RNA polymerase sigma-B factor